MKPLVGISCCSKAFGPNGLPNHAASDFCVQAVARFADGMPVLLPALGEATDADALLDRLDGLLLTGSRTDIAPHHYGQQPQEAAGSHDPQRDATTLPLIRAAVRRGTPILAICRGMQELNVALGGTLHQRLSDLPGRLRHTHCQPEQAELRTAHAHSIHISAGSRLSRLAPGRSRGVNSLHNQAIDRLAPGLHVEAAAPDGTIEAIGHGRSPFVLGVQWHPEFDVAENLLSRAIFSAFGAALYRPRQVFRVAAE